MTRYEAQIDARLDERKNHNVVSHVFRSFSLPKFREASNGYYHHLVFETKRRSQDAMRNGRFNRVRKKLLNAFGQDMGEGMHLFTSHILVGKSVLPLGHLRIFFVRTEM